MNAMATSPAPRTSDLMLKVTAPRVPKSLLQRKSLALHGDLVQGRPIVLVQAPAGFGKTSLLAQWRLEHLARGMAVAWISAQTSDTLERLLQSLALSVRVGAGRPTFGHVLLDAPPPPGLEGFTLWLAEVAQAAFDLVVVIDEADRLPAPSREGLAYLLRNAPPNLHFIVAARADVDLQVQDLVAYGECAQIGTAQLRFSLDETLGLAQQRQGAAFDRDRAARLHEIMEGWPLGIQLALAVTPAGTSLDVGALQARAGNMHAPLVGLLLGNLAPADLEFLTRVSILHHLHAQLCNALLPSPDTTARLERLLRDTPVFVTGELHGWMRMHSLAREVLQQRFEALPRGERNELHARACEWLAAEDMLVPAARHALASGQREKAYDLAERSLYESVMSHGRQAQVLDWLAHMPIEELTRRPRLMLASAWALAVGERHAEARRFVDVLLEQAGNNASLQGECALILGAAAIFADDPDRFAALHDPWADKPPLGQSALLQVHANRSALRALLAGEPAQARLRQQRAPKQGGASGNLDRWGEFIIAMTYWWEGQPLMVLQLLGPMLAIADNDLGRRSAFAATVAALHAAACWELDQPERATALLADRLDVLERGGLPEAVLLGFRTLARIAVAAGNEPQALALLGALDAVGAARDLPRLRMASLAEQIRLHARQYRASTCAELLARLEALDDPQLNGPLWRRSVAGMKMRARADVHIAARDWRGALAPLKEAEALAAQSHLQRDRIELMALRAWVMDRCGERARDLIDEAHNLAQAARLARVFDDAHPDLGAWAKGSSGDGLALAAAPAASAAPRPMNAPRATASAALTPKERQVLELLARNLSNKEIALAMQVGEETIKWHVKNLFAKLDAGTRKQVVGRAKILGLLAD
jgi:LuxR family maltose regulon positive regulatory protein